MSERLKNEKGFTLIELMIVIAIIGILAAVAIPQFAAYRIRAFNAAALSDVNNLNTSEATLFADWNLFGATEQANAAAGGANAGVQITAPGATPWIANTVGANIRSLQIGLSNGVTMHAATTAAPFDTFTAAAKHFQGNTSYAIDSDITAVYQNPTAGANAILPAGHLIAPTVNTDDYGTAAAGTAGWAMK